MAIFSPIFPIKDMVIKLKQHGCTLVSETVFMTANFC